LDLAVGHAFGASPLEVGAGGGSQRSRQMVPCGSRG
jgi:hypothetical protein